MEVGDMTVPCHDGFLNIRVGAIIIKDGKFLMVGSELFDYLYTVGGRVKFGETMEEAVMREVEEETGVHLEIDHLGIIHEAYYLGDVPGKEGKVIYELSFFFYMKVPEDFEPVCESVGEAYRKEYLSWASPEDPRGFMPEFFRTEVFSEETGIRHIVTDER